MDVFPLVLFFQSFPLQNPVSCTGLPEAHLLTQLKSPTTRQSNVEISVNNSFT